MSAYRRGGFLRYAAAQFVVLTALAMVLYPGSTWVDHSTTHYQLAHNDRAARDEAVRFNR